MIVRLLVRRDDRATHVVATVGADHVRGDFGAALGAVLKLAGLQCIV